MHPDSLLEKTFRLNSSHKEALGKLGLKSVRDLLYYFPTRYNNISEIKKIARLNNGDTAVVYGRVLSAKTTRAYRKKIPIGEVVIEDDTGKIKATWFHQAYAAKMVKKGDLVKLAGRVTAKKNGELYLANPEFERTGELPIDIGDSLFAGEMLESFAYAIYPESRGVTSRWIYHAIKKILASGVLDELKDPLPEHILEKYHLPTLKTSLIWIHSPKKDADAQSARKRFAFEEIFFIQLERQRARHAYKQNPAFAIETSQDLVEQFMERFPFEPTTAQKRAIKIILEDMKKDSPMSRLLEGDVGSGKTAVAATT
ncbi:MAG: OB-fold nucleic acid binding domain-containing protein, partial [Candidatus Yonathbacteria bacterium]|nr:OB-fold nucleic acid binding domain-containing protein [Candidatus Yonathbacteria bacterium]